MTIKWFRKLGPGLLFAGAAIGVSHLVQSTRAGADFGFGLLWALLAIHLVKYPFFQFGTRYATATGESLLEGYQKLGRGVLIAYFILNMATMFTIQAAVTIVTAGLAANLFGITNNPVSWSVFITLACFLMLIIGKYRLLDKLMKVIILVLTVSTLASLFIASVHTTDPISFQQVLPEGTVAVSFLIAFLGWMPAPLDVAVWQSLWTLEKQQESREKRTLKDALFDFNIGYVGTLILGVCFVGLGALVLFNSTTSLSNSALNFSQQLVSLYTDNLGKEMHLLIAIAAFTTMFSTTITTLDASPRAMHKTTDLLLRRPLKNGYWYWILFLAAGTLVLLAFFLSEMGRLVSIATILSFLTAPFYAIMNYWLISGKHTPVHARPSTGLKVLSYTGIIFLISFGIWYLSSL